jgi:hypothetical protein
MITVRGKNVFPTGFDELIVLLKRIDELILVECQRYIVNMTRIQILTSAGEVKEYGTVRGVMLT